MKRTLAALALVLVAAGCGDNATILSREYRNYNNEFIDALMTTTNETRAKIAKDKVIDTYETRIADLDKRMDIWEQNKEKEDVSRDTFTSESVALLFSENKRNQERHAREKDRLRKVLDALKAQNPGADPAKEWPALNELATSSKADAVVKQLTSGGKFAALISKFPNWKLKQDIMDQQKVFLEKVERFDKR